MFNMTDVVPKVVTMHLALADATVHQSTQFKPRQVDEKLRERGKMPQSPALSASSSKDPPPPLILSQDNTMMMYQGDEATVDEDDMKIQILLLTKLWRTLVGPSWQDMLPDPRGLLEIENRMD